MDSKDGLVVCLVLTTAYIFHSVLILQDEVKRQSSTIDLLKTSRDNTVNELQQQKLKLHELENTFLNFIDGNTELQEIVVSIKHKIKTCENKTQSLEETDIELKDNLSSLTNKTELNGLHIKAIEREQDLLKTSKDKTVDELQQQKLKLNELDNTFINFIDETSELQDIVVSIKHKLESSEHKIQSLKETDFEIRNSLSSIINKAESTTLILKAMERDKVHTETTILMMKTENMKQIQDLKETVTKLQSNYFNVKEGLVENKGHLIETFGNIFKETREVYRVIERIHGRLNNLEDSINRRRDSGIISLIREGVSRLVQFGLNFFLGPVAGYIE
ncbi:uncharacterized protein LOC143073184 [Mytilus galloprovincialis]|uniref:uncharacterized protein LOC143073184 n=1 Tax=Mytilus galloprovincialis TaxID=29158 RepID=UPI003F7CBB2B